MISDITNTLSCSGREILIHVMYYIIKASIRSTSKLVGTVQVSLVNDGTFYESVGPLKLISSRQYSIKFAL